MRGRTLRLLIFSLVILGLAITALGFSDINVRIPGVGRLERGGTGPLGLKLGLDLRGGGHLVYQADTGSRTEVTFVQAPNLQEVKDSLSALDLTDLQVEARGERAVLVKSASLDSARRQQVRDALQPKFGGIELFQVTEIPKPSPDQMAGVEDIIKRRVNLFGTDEPIIQRFGSDRLIVQLPGASGSRTEVKFREPVESGTIDIILGEMGFEDFKIDTQDAQRFRITTTSLNPAKQQELRTSLEERVGGIEAMRTTGGIEQAKDLIGQTAQLEFKKRTCTDDSCDTATDAPIGLTGDDLSSAYASTHPTTGEWVVNIEFNGRGADIFSELTQEIVGQPTKRIAVFRDDELLIAPVAQAWIRDGRSQITGSFTREDARTLSIQLESGRLPVPLKLIQESEVDALLGSESLNLSLTAGVLGLGLVMLFMVVYYRMAGVVASLALTYYAVIVLGVFKLIPVTLTLSGIAAFVLSVGMAVDANILIFERMKEEIRIGRTLSSSMEVGFNRAWPAIRDSNISTFITCGILLWFGSRLGGSLVTGFALGLLIGVAVSMFTALVVSRNLLQVLVWAGLGPRIHLFTPEPVRRPVPTISGGSK